MYAVSGKKVNHRPYWIEMSNLSAFKLCALDFEYIPERMTQFRLKIFTNSGVINLQISTTKYISFLPVTAQEVTFADRTTLVSIGSVNTVQLLIREAPDFIAPTLWPANSPDLSPVENRIWGKLQDLPQWDS